MGVWLALAGYLLVLGALARAYHRRSQVRLHRSRCDWRMFAGFVAGAVVTGGRSCSPAAWSSRWRR